MPYSSLPPMTSASFADTRSMVDTTPTSLANTEAPENVARQWSNLAQSSAENTPESSLPITQYYLPTASQATPPTETQYVMPPFYVAESQQVRNRSAIPPPSHLAIAETHTANSGTAIRPPRNSQFPQSGASAAGVYQRRQQRVNILSPAPPASAGPPRSRSSAHASRARSRPTSYHIPSAQPPTPHSSRSHVVPSNGINRPTGTTIITSPHERNAERNAQLTALLQNVHPSQVQALYNGALGHGREFGSEICVPKRAFDTPKESRPEPKETDELTVNMECKICMGQLVDTVLLPCGHAILCRWCADQHILSFNGCPQKKSTCPMCREPVKQKHRIYFP
ncbi:hypothetical protein BJY04DRAFT_215590 [Aspergillus karnatakaensis]|uniref:C3HC4 finger protein n=1 Tax=Aspergillus karnatakaensis TaxID=1810916 RepID=UPI003CCDFB95